MMQGKQPVFVGELIKIPESLAFEEHTKCIKR